MSNLWIRQILSFILLVILQVCLFNKIHLFGFATPLLYIYFIIKLPVDMNRNWIVVLSALMGLSIDLFNFTLGMNMLAATIIAFLRFYLLKLFAPRDIFESYSPSFSTFGKSLFFRYAFLTTLFHQIILFTSESFSLFDPLSLILRVFGSTVLTMLLIYALESLRFEKKA